MDNTSNKQFIYGMLEAIAIQQANVFELAHNLGITEQELTDQIKRINKELYGEDATQS